MNAHLDDLELAAAVAGLDLAPSAAEHHASCATCRASVPPKKPAQDVCGDTSDQKVHRPAGVRCQTDEYP